MKKVLSLVLIISACTFGCSKKKSGDKAGQPAAANPAVGANPMAGQNRPPQIRRSLGVISVDEVKDMIPAPDGARVLKAMQKAQVGERVEAAFCFNGGELAALGDKVKNKLTGAGWGNVTTREHPQLKDRIGVSAQKQPYILTGTIQRGQWPDCVGEKGQTYVSLGIHKIENHPMPAMGPGGAMPGAMAPGMAPPGAMAPGMAAHMAPPPGMVPGGVRPVPAMQPKQGAPAMPVRPAATPK